MDRIVTFVGGPNDGMILEADVRLCAHPCVGMKVVERQTEMGPEFDFIPVHGYYSEAYLGADLFLFMGYNE